jgi:hypothetical protein
MGEQLITINWDDEILSKDSVIISVTNTLSAIDPFLGNFGLSNPKLDGGNGAIIIALVRL